MAIGYLDDSKLTAIANSIRTKAGTSGTMTVDDMPVNIANIPTGGGDPDLEAVGQDILDINKSQETVLDLTCFSNYPGATWYYGLSDLCTEIKLPSDTAGIMPYSCSIRPHENGTTLIIPKSVAEIDKYAFARQILSEQDTDYNWIFSFEGNRTTDLNLVYYSFSYCKAASLVLPPETVLKGEYDNPKPDLIFYYSYIKNIDMSACTKITALGYQTFFHCEKLESIILPPNLQSIGRSGSSGSTFNFCTSLSTLTIPATVTSIQGEYTLLARRSGGTTFHFLGTTPPTRSGSIFGSASQINNFVGTIYVPYSADHSVLNAYLNDSSWSDVASHFQEEPQS